MEFLGVVPLVASGIECIVACVFGVFGVSLCINGPYQKRGYVHQHYRRCGGYVFRFEVFQPLIPLIVWPVARQQGV